MTALQPKATEIKAALRFEKRGLAFGPPASFKVTYGLIEATELEKHESAGVAKARYMRQDGDALARQRKGIGELSSSAGVTIRL